MTEAAAPAPAKRSARWLLAPLLAFAFFAFRFFDVVKPPPIRQVDQRVKGGFGVMLDDVFAAFYTLLAIAVANRLVG